MLPYELGDVDKSAFQIATTETLTQSINFVNERFFLYYTLDLKGSKVWVSDRVSSCLGSGLKFDSAEPDEVVKIVNSFYMLLERIRLQKKQLEEVKQFLAPHP